MFSIGIYILPLISKFISACCNIFVHCAFSLIILFYIWPQGFWGSGENGYLFSESWGALVIILGELGSKLIILGI